MFRSVLAPAFRSLTVSAKQLKCINDTQLNIKQTLLRCMHSGKEQTPPSSATHLSSLIDTPDASESSQEQEADWTSDREFKDIDITDFQSIYKEDQSVKSEIETVLKEYEFRKYDSIGRVPSNISVLEMQRILDECDTPHGRDKMFEYLFKREMAKLSLLRQKTKQKEITQKRLEAKNEARRASYGNTERTGLISPSGKIIYGLWHNSLFTRVSSVKMKGGSSPPNLIEAALFGTKIVFDFDYENYMGHAEAGSIGDQVQEAYGTNKFRYSEPYDLWFCNFNEEQRTPSYLLHKALPNLAEGTSMITIKKDCFTNYFPKSKIVYLTPDSKQPLKKIDYDNVYVIGVYNDKGNHKPLSYRKAESMGIATRCLPIDQNVAWQTGSKSLCVNHVLSILLEYKKNGGNWRNALQKALPKRKLKTAEALEELDAARKRKKNLIFNLV